MTLSPKKPEIAGWYWWKAPGAIRPKLIEIEDYMGGPIFEGKSIHYLDGLFAGPIPYPDDPEIPEGEPF